ncbi:chloroplast acyl-ACP thioesterase [Artemisia annua]|uniref:Chloroplast acyl-ACP thioesterase n=1 Tax=Artemisia annua TaxID=35608 RepID=A0A2U1QIM4_ARTAN|nr:chloroplast acyl-ACP thioesterase [Artemisia annua]
MNKEIRRLSKILDEVWDVIEHYFVDAPPVVDDDGRKLPKLHETTADYARNRLTFYSPPTMTKGSVNRFRVSAGGTKEVEKAHNGSRTGCFIYTSNCSCWCGLLILTRPPVTANAAYCWSWILLLMHLPAVYATLMLGLHKRFIRAKVDTKKERQVHITRRCNSVYTCCKSVCGSFQGVEVGSGGGSTDNFAFEYEIER